MRPRGIGNLKRKHDPSPSQRLLCVKKAKRKVYKVVPGAYLGVWRYSKDSLGEVQRLYVTRSGEVFSGREATLAYKVSSMQQEKGMKIASEEIYAEDTLEHWGVPKGLAERVRERGVDRLFSWQVECLARPSVLEKRKSLVFCAPTSGGKSLVAEILLIRSVLVHKRRALYVVPYISIVQEKLAHLQHWLSPVMRIEGFCSDRTSYSGDKFWHPFIDIGICTVEKAYGIVNKLLEDGTPDRLGCLVVDEIHMLGEGDRGGLLETLLMKAKRMQWQVVGMSATLPQAEEMAEWLGAEFYRGTFRPIPLEMYLVEAGCVKNRQLDLVRQLPSGDPTTTLVLEAVSQDQQTIVFCPSKQQCESVCKSLCSKLPPSASPLATQLQAELAKSPDFSPVLCYSLTKSSAFHHADLTAAERAMVEKYYRAGMVKVLCATSTLAAGVNLPAARVIIQSPFMGSQPLSCRNYQQMSGRAGRSEASGRIGESYLLSKKTYERQCRRLIAGEAEPVESAWKGESLRRALIDGLATGQVGSESELEEYIGASFRARKESKGLIEEANSHIEQLRNSGLLTSFTVSPLLKATFASMLPPQIGLTLNSELLQRGATALSTNDLFWLYLVTPRDGKAVAWRCIEKAFGCLKAEGRQVASELGLEVERVVRWEYLGVEKGDIVEPYYRLVAAVALMSRLDGCPIREVADRLDLPAGIIQSWEAQSEALCGMMVIYCQRLSLWMYASSFAALQGRLSRMCSDSLLQPLLALPSVKPNRAKALYTAGIRDPAALLATELSHLEELLVRTETQFHRSNSGEKQRNVCREAAAELKKQAKEWMEWNRPEVTTEEEWSESEEEREACEDLKPVLECLGAYIDSGLESDEYVALLQESLSTTTLL